MANRDIIAIGGSAGSSAVLQQVMADLPADLPASLFVTTHVPSQSASYVANMLARTAKLQVVEAIDGQPIERGCVYVAVPDHHLLVIDGTVRLGDGPRENMARPAIDPLFRSAALSYGSRAVGVVLSGLLSERGAMRLPSSTKRASANIPATPKRSGLLPSRPCKIPSRSTTPRSDFPF